MFIKYYKKYIYNLSKTLYRRDLNRVLLLLFHNLKPCFFISSCRYTSTRRYTEEHIKKIYLNRKKIIDNPISINELPRDFFLLPQF